MKTTITESEMKFVISDTDRLFYIEKSNLYEKLGSGIHTTEFVLLDEKNTLQFLEAKKTCPNVNNREESKEKKQKYEEYYQTLASKFIDSLNILAAGLLERYTDTGEIGAEIRNLESLQNVRIRFILVLKNAQESWLGGSKAELEQRLFNIRKIWKADVIVLNEELAARKGFLEELP